MTDYIHTNGNIQMMIRDTGGNVEFWVQTNQYTYNHQQTWSYDVNGPSAVMQFDMNNRGSWQYVGAAYPNGRQNVRFTMYDTGLGFPTFDYWVFIERARVPDPPSAPWFGNLWSDAVNVYFNDGYDGGMGIDQREIWISTDPNDPHWWGFVNSGVRVGGLVSGLTHYVWAKVHNGIGWSDLSGRSQFTTLRIPDAPNPVKLTAVQQTSVHASFTFAGKWDGDTPIREWQIGYGTNANNPSSFKSGFDIDITGLTPGITYYFWSRARNDIGWGAWSSRAQVTLVAGASVLVGILWHRAVPYVNVNGVWKIARPWTKAGGIWKETI